LNLPQVIGNLREVVRAVISASGKRGGTRLRNFVKSEV